MLTALHISHWDKHGGSGRSAYRVHTGLKRLGVRSRMLVGKKLVTTYDDDIGLISDRWWLRSLDRTCGEATDRLSLKYLSYPSSFVLPRRLWFREADVLQLYNIHGGYFSHTVLPRLSAKLPVVWRLSDMWPMTGHCAYPYDCERWMTGCGACPRLADYPGLSKDRTALLWRIKKRLYSRCKLTIVAPSKWIADLAKESPLLGKFPVHLIPNGLDTTVFKPIPKESARQILNIDPSARVILFSAEALSSSRKGGQVLREALKRLGPSAAHENIQLLMMGYADATTDFDFPVHRLGYINDDTTMAIAYSAADLFVLPTLADNLPNGALESMACGTPVISFDVGGVSEAVRHLETGYLASYKDAADLTQGLSLLLANDKLRAGLSGRCREVAEREYSLELQAERFRDLYGALVDGGPQYG